MLSQIISKSNDVFSDTFRERETALKDDPLVLACSLKRLHEKDGQWRSIEDTAVLENVDDDIRAYAEDIRKYFSKKFFWNNLSNIQSVSSFRSRALYLLENRVRNCKDKDIGCYFKLPWFYEEDMAYEKIKKNLVTDDIPDIVYGGSTRTKSNLTLTFVDSTISTQSKRKIERFWFTDSVYLYQIEVATDNVLINMFKDLIEERKTLTFSTYYNKDRIDKMYFYKLFQFNLVKEYNA